MHFLLGFAVLSNLLQDSVNHYDDNRALFCQFERNIRPFR